MHIPQTTICIHFGHIRIYKIVMCAFLQHLCTFWHISNKHSVKAVIISMDCVEFNFTFNSAGNLKIISIS